MSHLAIILTLAGYVALLFFVAWLSSRNTTTATFFTGGRSTPRLVAAVAMVGAAMSGVTYISVPGSVLTDGFSYLQTCLGFFVGYSVIAFVLIPLYYRLGVVSLYEYLDHRFGIVAHRTGAWLFFVAKIASASLRAFVICVVLQGLLYDHYNIPFWANVAIMMALVWLYTRRGGVKSVVWVEMVKTLIMSASIILAIIFIIREMGFNLDEATRAIADSDYSQTLFTENPLDRRYFWKQFVAGIFLVVAMTGLDQDMMQKNLTCKSLRDAQKNVLTSSFFFVVVNVLFMSLGAALIYYAQETGLQLPTNANGVVVNDKIFPTVAFSLDKLTSIVFMIGLIAAGYSSADGTLTALTTTFCFDFLHFDKNDRISEEQKTRYRKFIHVGFALLYLLVIIMFRPFHNESLIDKIFEIAGYTYGPLLGLYTFGLFVKNRKPNDKYVPIVAIASPIISYILNLYSKEIFFGYQFGFEILIVNGLLTFVALMIISKKEIVK